MDCVSAESPRWSPQKNMTPPTDVTSPVTLQDSVRVSPSARHNGLQEHVFIVLLIMAAGVVPGMSNRTKSPFTCEAGNFVIGRNASVTCHLGSDVLKSDFEIMRYPFEGKFKNTGLELLRCIWIGQNHRCLLKEGVSFHQEIQENVTITITNVTKASEGRYSCQLIPSGDRSRHMCNLTVEDVPAPGSDGNDVPAPGSDGNGHTGVSLTVASILLSLGIPMVFFIMVCFYCNRHAYPCCQAEARSRTLNAAEEIGLTEPFPGPDLQK